MNRQVLLLSAFLLFCAPALAQTTKGAIVGTVTDSSGGVVPNAAITVLNMDTNEPVKTTSDGAGNFVVTPLLVGRYSVTAEKPGFKTEVRPGVEIDVQSRVRTDFILQVGSVAQTIEVSAPNPLLQTDSSYEGQVMEAKSVDDLPLNGRYLTMLAVLAEGAVPGQMGSKDQKTGSFSVNGLRPVQNTFLLDGIDNTNREAGETSGKDYVIGLPPDAVGEYKVQTNNMSAEFGISAGGVMNVTTKGGTNEFHGDLFEFDRNSAFAAKNFFDSLTNPIPGYRLNQFGATAGGPLVIPGVYNGRNKTFFFGDFQITRIRQGETYVNTVPTASMRLGNFSGFNTIYDPESTAIVNGVATRTPFPNNMIPQTEWDSVGVKIMNLYSLPNQPGTVSGAGPANNFLDTPTLIDDISQFDIRLDHRFSEKDSALLRFSFADENNVVPPTMPQGDGSTSHGEFTIADRVGVITETHIFNPRTVNEFRGAYTWDYLNEQIPDFATLGNINEAAILGIPGIPGAGIPWPSGGYPIFSVSSLTTIGSSASVPTIAGSTEFQFVDIVSMVRGPHTLKVGADYKPRLVIQFLQPFATRGYFTFNGDATRNPQSTGNTGLGAAALLLGTESAAELTNGVWDNTLEPGYAFFVQDDYKVAKKLTLNVGLRYQFDSHPMERHNAYSSFNTITGKLDVARGAPPHPFPAYFDSADIPVNFDAPRTLVPNQHDNFAPRFGFAYNLFPKTVIRSGYGIFWTSEEMGPLSSPNMGQNQPFYQAVTYTEASVAVPNSIVSQLAAGFPLTALTTGVAGQAQGLFTISPTFRNPYAQVWNFGVQQELGRGVLWEIDYAGSKGTGMYEFRRENIASATANSAISQNSRRPYPFMNDDPYDWCSCDSSHYEALESKVEKRWSGGLSFLATYAYGKLINQQSGASTGYDAGGFRDALRHPGWEMGLASFNVTQRLVFSYSYLLPVGHGKRFGSSMNREANVLLGGWQLAGIDSFDTGMPTTATASANPANISDEQSRPDVNLSAPLYPAQKSPAEWFNPAHFQVAVAGTYGNSGRNTIEGPGLREMDFSVFKNFQLSERFRAEFRAECFNLPNHPNFQANGVTGTFNGSGAGSLTLAQPSRQIQFALKLFF